MSSDEKYMYRCLQLAAKGRGQVSPNPMVGAVVVYNDQIIGEGYHRCYGHAHAEVNAINSVKDKSLLKESTVYVSLEPCAHYGKTPPCAQLLIDSRVKRVVVACRDPFPAVSGRGIEMLIAAGIEVEEGVLTEEARELNREFFTKQQYNRPYVCLKWAESRDAFMDRDRTLVDDTPTLISNDFTRVLVHKRRSEIDAIMIGTNTAQKDNASLTTRLWNGKNPIRILLDRTGRIAENANVLNSEAPTWVFTENVSVETQLGSVTYIPMTFDQEMLKNILTILAERKINSLLVEGGQQLLQSFIDQGKWDRAFREIGDLTIGSGVKAPLISGNIVAVNKWKRSKIIELMPLS